MMCCVVVRRMHVCMCVHMCECNVCSYVYIIHISMHVCKHACVYLCAYDSMCACMCCENKCVCMHVCLQCTATKHACMYEIHVCVHVRAVWIHVDDVMRCMHACMCGCNVFTYVCDACMCAPICCMHACM